MLKVHYSREEATLFIKNHGDEESTILTVYYSDGINIGEFGGKFEHSTIIWDDLIHFDFPLEVEILTQQGYSIKNYTFKETSINNSLILIEVKEKPLEEIIKWAFEDTHSLYPPVISYLQKNVC